jgi:hypothetical protein
MLAIVMGFGAFNVVWQLLGTELPGADEEESTITGKKRTLKVGVDPKSPKSLESGGKAVQVGVEPSISEMYFAAPFQAIVWSHTAKDLIVSHRPA